jgi:hypothetical protein
LQPFTKNRRAASCMKDQSLFMKPAIGIIWTVSLWNRWCSAAMTSAGVAATKSIKNAMAVDALPWPAWYLFVHWQIINKGQ